MKYLCRDCPTYDYCYERKTLFSEAHKLKCLIIEKERAIEYTT